MTPADAAAPETTTDTARGLTPAEVARLIRVSPDRVRAMIAKGELQAIDTAPRRCGRRRYIVLPDMLAAWVRSHQAATETPRPRRRKRVAVKDYYPD